MDGSSIHDIPETADDEYKEVAWGIHRYGEPIKPLWINRGKVTDHMVKFEMLYSGICHTDCHVGKNDWKSTVYPVVPGHELLGRVVEVGNKVTKFKVGDMVGVGCFVDSCLECEQCLEGDDHECQKGISGTQNGRRKHSRVPGGAPDQMIYGGYSASNVVHERFVLRIPDGLAIDKAAPIMCAGITMY